MELFTCYVTISFTLISLFYLWKIVNWVWLTPKTLEARLRRQGFAGNPYRLITGDLKEIAAIARQAQSKPITFTNDILPRVYPIFHSVFQKFGERSFVWFGPRPAVMISEPEIIREILAKNYIFEKIPGSPLARILGKGLVMLEKEEWAKHRKLINPAFHVQKLKNMVGSFHLSCSNMLRKWDEAVGSEGTKEVDVWGYLQAMTSDVIARAAFGRGCEQGAKIFRLQMEQADAILRANRSLNFPGSRFLPTKENRRMNELTNEIESLFMSIITTRMKAENNNDHNDNNNDNDLLSVLLDSISKETKENGAKAGMSMKEVIEECKIFFFAGQDTSASLLVWTLILLSHHQDWQARARDEVLQAFGTNKPDYQDLTRLKIVSMIVYEVLRLYPPIVMLARLTHKDYVLEKVEIPGGVQLMLPVLLLHHDMEIWGEDAKEFRPERFGKGVSEATRGRLTFFPFGAGPRVCIAQNFALLQAKMALATILQRYSFQMSPSYMHAPHTVVSLQPQHGAPLILTKL